jgi:thymidylate synthase (FAD)
MGTDLSVVNAARVSFGKKSEWYENEAYGCENYPNCGEVGCHQDFTYELYEKDEKLIKYLAEHKHTSPFGHAFASFHVKAPIFVARQLVKHKFLRWNEISRRYVDSKPEFYEPDEWRGKSADKKQGSEGVVELYNVPDKRNPNFLVGETQTHYQKLQHELYQSLLDAGVCEEQARMVLPQNTMTEWYWSGSLDAFANMCRLRCASDTQYETRIVADQIHSSLSNLFPVSFRALMDEDTNV